VTQRDQAYDLRRLMLERVNPAGFAAAGAADRPAIVAVTSGKGGTGVTTVAVNLAVALAQQERHVLLIDADQLHGSVALACGLHEDVVAHDFPEQDSLRLGPGGIRLWSGCWGTAPRGHRGPLRETLAALSAESMPIDVAVVDLGNGMQRWTADLCRQADVALLVTTTDAASLMNTYALTKLLAPHHLPPHVAWLVNLALWPRDAESVQSRLIRACRRFLALETVAAGWLPHDLAVPQSAAAALPMLLAAPTCEAALALQAAATHLAAVLLSRPTTHDALLPVIAHP